MGMIYKRGEIYWIKYYCGGRPFRSRRRRGSGGSGIEGIGLSRNGALFLLLMPASVRDRSFSLVGRLYFLRND